MLYITNKGVDYVKKYSGKENILSINNAMFVKGKNNFYTYLKDGNFLLIEQSFINDFQHDYFYFSQIKEISVDEQEKYKELALSKIKNVDIINDIQFKGFYLVDKNKL